MTNLSGTVVAIVGADGSVAEATARRLAKDGASLIIGPALALRLEDMVSELQWECASVACRSGDAADPDDLGDLAAFARSTFGRLDAVVSSGGSAAASGLRQSFAAAAPELRRCGARRLVNVAAAGDDALALSETLRRDDPDLRVTVISRGLALHPGATDIRPDAVARAVAFALSEPGDVDVTEIIVRPTALAAA